MKKIDIAIVDDEMLFAQGLKQILSSEKDMSISLIASDGSDLLNQLESRDRWPDVFLLDLRMKPMNGIDTVKSLKEREPEVKVIILSTHYQEAFLGYMVKLGVSAFLPKNTNPARLMEGIRKVNARGLFLSEDNVLAIREQMQNRKLIEPPVIGGMEQLTRRETEVLQLICDQHTNAEIAEKLFLSIRTVEGHRNNLLSKTGVKNTVGLVIYALIHQIVDVDQKLLEFSI